MNNISYYIGLSILSNVHTRGKGAERRKLLSAEARRVLSLLEGRPIEKDEIAEEAQGRPFFPDREVDFNISHSGALTTVSYVRGGNLRTGCDVELVRPRTRIREIANKYFSAPERDYIFTGDISGEAGFYRIWTLKESFIKLKGLSVLDMASCPSFITGEGSNRGQFAFGAQVCVPLSFSLYEISNGSGDLYMLAAAIEGTQQVQPQILVFSQPSLACKKTAEIKAAPNPAETVRPKM